MREVLKLVGDRMERAHRRGARAGDLYEPWPLLGGFAQRQQRANPLVAQVQSRLGIERGQDGRSSRLQTSVARCQA